MNASSPPVRSNRRILLNQSSNKPEVQQGLDGGKIVIPFETKSINIANGGMAHIVNIPLSSSKLEATKSYVCVPRKDTKTYLNVSFFFTTSWFYSNVFVRRRLRTLWMGVLS